MANEPIQAKLILLDRNTYEAWKDAGTLSDTGLYIVREENSATNNMLTFCVGEGTQTEIMDITQNLQHDDVELSFDDQNNTYNLPPAYQIKGKLWFVQQTGADRDVYHVFMWNGERFLDCFGEPNNLAVVAELPDVGVTNNAYILRGDTENILYVFDGTNYQVVGDVLRPDNITIKFNSQNQIKGVGAFGMDATIDGTTHTAQAGSEIFNYIDNGQHNNIATGASSSASGIGNITTGDYSEAHNIGDYSGVVLPTIPDINFIPADYSQYTPEAYRFKYGGVGGFCNDTFGMMNTIHGNSSYFNFITGAFNDIRFNAEFFTVVGKFNQVNDKFGTDDPTTCQRYFVICGSDNNTRLSDFSEYITIIGRVNKVQGSGSKYITCVGEYNYIGSPTDAYTEHIYVFGKDNSFLAGQTSSSDLATNCFVFGRNNSLYGGSSRANNDLYLFGHHLKASKEPFTPGGQYILGRYNPQGMVSGPKRADGVYGDGWKISDANYVAQFILADGTDFNSGNWNTPVAFYNLAVATYDNYTSDLQDPGYYSYGKFLDGSAMKGVTYSGDFMASDGSTLRPLQFMFSMDELGVPVPAEPVFNCLPENTSEYTFKEPIRSITLDGYMDEMMFETDKPHRYAKWIPYNQTIYTYLPQHKGAGCGCGLVDGYSCVLMFRPTADATVENLIKLVPGTGSPNRVQTNIYVMNPDFDLSTVSVVHAFLYLDGFRNLCIIYGGYMENGSLSAGPQNLLGGSTNNNSEEPAEPTEPENPEEPDNSADSEG